MVLVVVSLRRRSFLPLQPLSNLAPMRTGPLTTASAETGQFVHSTSYGRTNTHPARGRDDRPNAEVKDCVD